MSGAHVRPSMAGYRDEITELVAGGAPFGDVENAIDGIADLTEEQKAALWLYAFSLRDPSEQQLEAGLRLVLVE